MANYVTNRVVMAGIKHLPLFDEEGEFDFNRVVPMPQSLSGIEEGSVTPDAILYALTDGLRLDPDEFSAEDKKILDLFDFGGVYGHFVSLCNRIACLKESLSKGDEPSRKYREKLAELGPVYVDNLRRYGFPTWYGWSLNKWGTKWNASDTVKVSEDEIIFFTAWDAPTPVLLALSEKYPDSEIELAYCDEDPYGAMGYATFVKGQEIDAPVDPQSSEGKALYEELVGFYPGDEE